MNTGGVGGGPLCAVALLTCDSATDGDGPGAWGDEGAATATGAVTADCVRTVGSLAPRGDSTATNASISSTAAAKPIASNRDEGAVVTPAGEATSTRGGLCWRSLVSRGVAGVGAATFVDAVAGAGDDPAPCFAGSAAASGVEADFDARGAAGGGIRIVESPKKAG